MQSLIRNPSYPAIIVFVELKEMDRQVGWWMTKTLGKYQESKQKKKRVLFPLTLGLEDMGAA